MRISAVYLLLFWSASASASSLSSRQVFITQPPADRRNLNKRSDEHQGSVERLHDQPRSPELTHRQLTWPTTIGIGIGATLGFGLSFTALYAHMYYVHALEKEHRQHAGQGMRPPPSPSPSSLPPPSPSPGHH
ncbi:hypothetical protein CF336_g4910 [Tilletia laevis]|nr:hypothetical protein CF336_g4910 [Tilletia laevis]KAE8195137.1 hypothetical protein CF328_g4535 [Tilletia controversa]